MELIDKFIEKYNKHFPGWEPLITAKGNEAININAANKNLLDLKHAYDSVGLKFWLVFGTALGAYRDNSLIVWDRDTDVAIFDIDKELIFPATDILIEKKLLPLRVFLDNKKRFAGITYGRENETLDVCFFQKRFGKYRCLTHWADLHQFDILDTIKFLGEDFKIPSDTENYFVDRYGEDWKRPIMGKSAIS